MGKLFKDLEKAYKDILAHTKGKKKLRTKCVEIPEPPEKYEADDIKKIRVDLHYSQNIFAKLLNVSIKTVQSWESGRRAPSHAALRLLEIIDTGVVPVPHHTPR